MGRASPEAAHRMEAELDHGTAAAGPFKHRTHDNEREDGVDQDCKDVAHDTVAGVVPKLGRRILFKVHACMAENAGKLFAKEKVE